MYPSLLTDFLISDWNFLEWFFKAEFYTVCLISSFVTRSLLNIFCTYFEFFLISYWILYFCLSCSYSFAKFAAISSVHSSVNRPTFGSKVLLSWTTNPGPYRGLFDSRLKALHFLLFPYSSWLLSGWFGLY
jgi:hypothetical protein